MAQQIGLFGAVPRVIADDARGAIVYYPQVLSAEESVQLFESLRDGLDWAQETMWMYDRDVAVPRLIARFMPGEGLPAQLQALKERAESRLGARFNALSVQYYRDANDSVAWHSDHTEDLVARPVVAVASFGAAREMQIRTKSRPRTSWSLDLEPGSLLVMSGLAQEHFEHHIPKSPRPVAGRISVALRQRRA